MLKTIVSLHESDILESVDAWMQDDNELDEDYAIEMTYQNAYENLLNYFDFSYNAILLLGVNRTWQGAGFGYHVLNDISDLASYDENLQVVIDTDTHEIFARYANHDVSNEYKIYICKSDSYLQRLTNSTKLLHTHYKKFASADTTTFKKFDY